MKKKVSIYVCSVILSVVLIGCGAQSDDINKNADESRTEITPEVSNEIVESEPKTVELSETELFQQQLETLSDEELVKLGDEYLNKSYAKDNKNSLDDAEKAKKCFEKAAEYESVDGYRRLMSLARSARNYQKAFEYNIKIAEKTNDVEEIGAIAFIYQCGDIDAGVERNSDKAIEWYEKAVNLGSTKAMNDIGFCYLHGIKDYDETILLEIDYEKAYYWFQKCADANDGSNSVEAMVELGIMNYYGWGVAKDRKAASELFDKAIELGGDTVYEDIAYAYLDADDIKEAKKWWKLHAKTGCDSCEKAIYEF